MQEVLELTASRDVQQTSEWYFVDKLIHTELNRKRIGLGHGVGYLEDLLLENQDP